GVRAATAIKQAINFLHEVAQCSQLRQATRDLLQPPTLCRRQLVLDEEMTMLEEIRDFVCEPLPLACGALSLGGSRAATLRRQLAPSQCFSHLGHSAQDRLGQFFDNVEFADLVRNVAEHLTQRPWIERRGVSS